VAENDANNQSRSENDESRSQGNKDSLNRKSSTHSRTYSRTVCESAKKLTNGSIGGDECEKTQKPGLQTTLHTTEKKPSMCWADMVDSESPQRETATLVRNDLQASTQPQFPQHKPSFNAQTSFNAQGRDDSRSRNNSDVYKAPHTKSVTTRNESGRPYSSSREWEGHAGRGDWHGNNEWGRRKDSDKWDSSTGKGSSQKRNRVSSRHSRSSVARSDKGEHEVNDVNSSDSSATRPVEKKVEKRASRGWKEWAATFDESEKTGEKDGSGKSAAVTQNSNTEKRASTVENATRETNIDSKERNDSTATRRSSYNTHHRENRGKWESDGKHAGKHASSDWGSHSDWKDGKHAGSHISSDWNAYAETNKNSWNSSKPASHAQARKESTKHSSTKDSTKDHPGAHDSTKDSSNKEGNEENWKSRKGGRKGKGGHKDPWKKENKDWKSGRDGKKTGREEGENRQVRKHSGKVVESTRERHESYQ
jgi:hypothetical protein